MFETFYLIGTHDEFDSILRTYGLDTADIRIFLMFYVSDDRFHVSVISDRLSDSVTQSVYSLSVQDHWPPHAFPVEPCHKWNPIYIAMTCERE